MFTDDERRVEGREVRPELVMCVLKRGPRCVCEERRQDDEGSDLRNPPCVAAHGLAEFSSCELDDLLTHRVRFSTSEVAQRYGRRKWAGRPRQRLTREPVSGSPSTD